MDEPHAPQLRARSRPPAAAPPTRVTDPALVRGFRTPIRGHVFAARPPGGAVPAGRVRLVREPHNPVDPWAVAVWTAEGVPWRLGYLDRSVAARVAPALDAGARIDGRLDGWVEAPGGWQRPLVAVADRCRATAPPGGHQGRSASRWGRPPGVTRRAVAGPRVPGR